jgi:hypothetical protein
MRFYRILIYPSIWRLSEFHKQAAEVRVNSRRGLISWSDPEDYSLQGRMIDV